MDVGNQTEFIGGYHGTCGEDAYAGAKAKALGRKINAQDLLDATHWLQATKGPNGKPLADQTGATTLSALGTLAHHDGFTVALEWDYSEPFNHDWHAVLLQWAGTKPIILQVAKASNLTAPSGHDEAGVKYHFVMVDDKSAAGYLCVDGDNSNPNVEPIYSYATLSSAVVCGLLMLEPKETSMPNRTWPGIGSGLTAELNLEELPATYTVLLDEKAGGSIPGRPDEIAVVVGDSNSDRLAIWNRKTGTVEHHWAGHLLLSYITEVARLNTVVADLQRQQKPTPTPVSTTDQDAKNRAKTILAALEPYRQLIADLQQLTQ